MSDLPNHFQGSLDHPQVTDLRPYRVLEILDEWSSEDDGFWHGYSQLHDELWDRYEIKVTDRRLRAIMSKLRYDGIIEYGPTYDQDGMVSGSGYFFRGFDE